MARRKHPTRVYNHAQPKTGLAKVKWLINRIKRDRTISKKMKVRRIAYLIALNKKHRWIKMDTVRKLVKKAIEQIKKK